MKDSEILKNPRVIVVQKLYSHHLNTDSEITFPKHRYRKFIKDVVNGTIERKDLIQNLIEKELKEDINDDEINDNGSYIRIYVYAQNTY